jgi:hypothetical protein
MHRFQAGCAALCFALAPVPLAAQTSAGPPESSPQPSPGAPSPDAAPAPATTTPPEPAPEPETPPPPAARAPVSAEAEPEPALVPPARDTLGGHVIVGASGSFAAPFGKLDSETAASDLLGVGPGFDLDVGFGVSRSLVLGVDGQLLLHTSPEACPECNARSFAGGVFVRYHVVQGVRFDPWISAGLGYRGTKVKLDGESRTFSGLEWLRLQVGGDWYPLSVLGFGPFVGLDLGTYFAHTSGANAAVHVNLLAGLRVVLDFPGK